jgi:uncharacterized membrane protein HdeD (DUF308 family)
MNTPAAMNNALARNWWLVVLRGVAAIIFGVLALLNPGAAILGLVLVFGVYALVDGVMAIVSAFYRRQSDARWWAVALEGLIGVAVGVLAILWPGITAISLLYLIAAWAIITGIMEMVAAVRLRKEITGEWLLFLAGVLSVIAGIAIAFMPGPGAVAVVWTIAAYALVSGIVMIALGLRLRGWDHRSTTPTTPAAPMQRGV